MSFSFDPEPAIQQVMDVMMPVKPPDMSDEDFRRMQHGLATKYVEVVSQALWKETAKLDTITFDREAFDWFMVQVAKRNLLTPDMGEILNYLLEREVKAHMLTTEQLKNVIETLDDMRDMSMHRPFGTDNLIQELRHVLDPTVDSPKWSVWSRQSGNWMEVDSDLSLQDAKAGAHRRADTAKQHNVEDAYFIYMEKGSTPQ